MFIDRVKIFVRAGNGGDGCLSFRREKFVPRGGPDGGNGGKGGEVIIEVDENVSNVLRLWYNAEQRAESGGPRIKRWEIILLDLKIWRSGKRQLISVEDCSISRTNSKRSVYIDLPTS